MPATKKELLLAIVAFLSIPGLAELTLRVSHYSAEPQLYAPDPARGWKLRANLTGVVTGENRQFVRINSHGFRDVEHLYEKPQGMVRIAVLGNSWTEALQVSQEATYTSVLQTTLTSNRCFAGQRVEVLNFGVAGYSTAQELLTLQQEVWKYDPDIVLLALYPARDIANNVRALNNAVNPEQSPYFLYRDDRLILDDSFRSLPVLQPHAIALEHLSYQVNQWVRLLQATGALQRLARTRFAMAAMKEKAAQTGIDNLEYSIYAPPSDPAMESGLANHRGFANCGSRRSASAQRATSGRDPAHQTPTHSRDYKTRRATAEIGNQRFQLRGPTHSNLLRP